MTMGRILGIDFGEKRIGVAVSDTGGMVATPLCVLTPTGPRKAVDAVAALVLEKQAVKVVVGLPMRMDGGEGPAAEKARAFAASLRAVVGVPVELSDERFSSVTANRVLIEGGARRARRKEVVDKLAAQILLQHYLDLPPPMP